MIQWRPVFSHMASLGSKGSWETSSLVSCGEENSLCQNANSLFYAMCCSSVLFDVSEEIRTCFIAHRLKIR